MAAKKKASPPPRIAAPVLPRHLEAASDLFDATVLIPQPRAIDRIAQRLANIEHIAKVEKQILGNTDRWVQISKTSPSGKTLFVCLSCGHITPGPSKTCSMPVKLFDGVTRECADWEPATVLARQVAERQGLKRALKLVQVKLRDWPPFSDGHIFGKRLIEDLAVELGLKEPPPKRRRRKG